MTTAGTAAALLAVLATGSDASAHAELVGTTPRAGEPVPTAPSAVTLTFSEELLDVGADVAVADQSAADARDLASAEPIVDGHLVTVELEPLSTGEYEVRWRVVSADGHPVLGSFSFMVSGPAATEEPIEPVVPAAPATADDAVAVPSAPDRLGAGLVLSVLAPTAACIVGGGAVVWILGIRRRRRIDRTGRPDG